MNYGPLHLCWQLRSGAAQNVLDLGRVEGYDPTSDGLLPRSHQRYDVAGMEIA